MKAIAVGVTAALLVACASEIVPTDTPTVPTLAVSPAAPVVEPEATPTEVEDLPLEELEFRLTSAAYQQAEAIPALHSCDGENISPRLTWTNPPSEPQSFALIFDDPDAPGGTWVHWVLFNLPPAARSLPEAIDPDPMLANGALHGSNSWNSIGYGGPCPPSGEHRYFLKLYALDVVLDLEVGATKEQVLEAMEGHILAQTELMGTYSR
ncbi:MAG: YbhB/YbcL family Raf kinase inhibitor-like protein [Anaerolineales bacterium]